jgi:hypothetical protein
MVRQVGQARAIGIHRVDLEAPVPG